MFKKKEKQDQRIRNLRAQVWVCWEKAVCSNKPGGQGKPW